MDSFKATTHADTPDGAEHLARQDFGSSTQFRGDVSYHARFAGDDRFALAEIKLGGSFSVEVDLDTVMMVSATGEYGWVSSGETGDIGKRPALLERGLPLQGTIRDANAQFVNFGTAPLEAMAQAMFADDHLRVRFDLHVPISERHDASIRKALQFATSMAETGAFEVHLVRASLYRYLAATMLETFALHGDPNERAMNSAALWHSYQRAVAFIDEHASLPITIEDVAAAASLSTRQLDYAFAAHSLSEGTVAGRLRAARLSAAHEDLVAGDPTLGDTVAQIALRWGFSPSHFAAAYRKTYGANPKWVLDR